eukprot:4716492-Pyramimonas_sp.AAC.1
MSWLYSAYPRSRCLPSSSPPPLLPFGRAWPADATCALAPDSLIIRPRVLSLAIPPTRTGVPDSTRAVGGV